MQQLLDGVVPLVVVGFSPAPALVEVAAKQELTGTVLSDPERAVYRRLELVRAPWQQVYVPRTILRSMWHMVRRGHRVHVPIEDDRQMGGDTIVVDGHVVRRWRPDTPVDRVTPSAIADEVHALLN